MSEVPTRLPPQPWLAAPDTRRILEALTRDGTRVRFVGGCVRNALIGAVVGDLDAATPDPPDTVMKLLTDAGLRAIPTGIEHGTVTAVFGDTVIEVTTLRHDVETDGRHAAVAFGADWDADARRRDFTMNAIYADPDGTLYDPVGGVADLIAGRVRFVGDARTRIAEDYLRILRFFRYYVWYGRGGLDPEALAAIADARDGLSRLSGERVQKELLRLLGAVSDRGALMAALEAMKNCGVLGVLLPEATHMARLSHLVALDVPDLSVTSDAVLRLGALTLGGVDQAQSVALRLRLSNRLGARLIAMVSDPHSTASPNMSSAEARRALYLLGPETFTDRLLIAWADLPAPKAQAERRGLLNLLDLAAHWSKPIFPVSGQDVLAAGVAPGPEVGRLLTALEDWWIAEDFAPARRALLRKLAEIRS